MLTVTVVNPKRFTPKNKLVTYTGALVELYNWKNHGQVHKIHRMIELEKMRGLITENLCNLGAHWIIEISLVLHSTHMVSKDQDNVVFCVNNYIDWDQFNQLYDPDWMKKRIKNTDIVARKLRPALTRATNQRLEIPKEKRRKKEEIVERRKTKAIAAKRQRAKGGISLSSEEEKNYESDTKDETDPNQANNDKNLLQL